MQELLFFQFAQGLLVDKMEWWLPNSLHGKLEIGSPPLTFQSFLRVNVARCIDIYFLFLIFQHFKDISFCDEKSMVKYIIFLQCVIFFWILSRFSLNIWFSCGLIWCTHLFCLGFIELLESVHLCFIILGKFSGIIFQIFFLPLLFFAFWDSNYIYVRTLILSSRSLRLY